MSKKQNRKILYSESFRNIERDIKAIYLDPEIARLKRMDAISREAEEFIRDVSSLEPKNPTLQEIVINEMFPKGG